MISPFLPRRSRQCAFTLIELLVVISIIGVLAGILLPVVGSVTNKAKAVESKSTASQIVTAIKNYQVEYGQYPNPDASTGATGAAGVDVTYDITTGNAQLFKVLQAINTQNDGNGNLNYNSRRVKYFEARDAKNASAPRSGFVPSVGFNASGGNSAPNSETKTIAAGDLVDSWGNRFCVRIDAGYTEAIFNPYYAGGKGLGANDVGTEDTTQVLRFGVAAWTYGLDGRYGNAGNATVTSIGDDVVSWQ